MAELFGFTWPVIFAPITLLKLLLCHAETEFVILRFVSVQVCIRMVENFHPPLSYIVVEYYSNVKI